MLQGTIADIISLHLWRQILAMHLMIMILQQLVTNVADGLIIFA